MRKLLLRVGITLCVLWNCFRALSAFAVEPNVADDATVIALIDKLVQVTERDPGYRSIRSGSDFLPLWLPPSALSFASATPAPCAIRSIVECGALAVPQLIAHLDDERPSKIVIVGRDQFPSTVPLDGSGLCFTDQYDYNLRTTQKPDGVNHDPLLRNRPGPQTHVVTVGDLCFMALGQIVNRGFWAVRDHRIPCINSPCYSKALREVVTKEWGQLTPQRHQASLVRDIQESDGEQRREGATLRLGYYYRDALEPLALQTASRARLVLWASLPILLCGLALIYFPALRHPAGIFALAILVLAAGLVDSEAALLLAQASTLGVGLAIVAALLARTSLRPAQPVTVPVRGSSKALIERGTTEIYHRAPSGSSPASTSTDPMVSLSLPENEA